jgi:hypothetical protein
MLQHHACFGGTMMLHALIWHIILSKLPCLNKKISPCFLKKMGNPGSAELRTTKLNAHGFHPRRFSSPNKP